MLRQYPPSFPRHNVKLERPQTKFVRHHIPFCPGRIKLDLKLRQLPLPCPNKRVGVKEWQYIKLPRFRFETRKLSSRKYEYLRTEPIAVVHPIWLTQPGTRRYCKVNFEFATIKQQLSRRTERSQAQGQCSRQTRRNLT